MEEPFKLHNELCRNMTNSSDLEINLKENEKLIHYNYKESPCRLFCSLDNSETFFDMLIKLPDGTKCRYNEDNICISGICHVSFKIIRKNF